MDPQVRSQIEYRINELQQKPTLDEFQQNELNDLKAQINFADQNTQETQSDFTTNIPAPLLPDQPETSEVPVEPTNAVEGETEVTESLAETGQTEATLEETPEPTLSNDTPVTTQTEELPISLTDPYNDDRPAEDAPTIGKFSTNEPVSEVSTPESVQVYESSSPLEQHPLVDLATQLEELMSQLEQFSSREISLTKTKLEEAHMWLKKELAKLNIDLP